MSNDNIKPAFNFDIYNIGFTDSADKLCHGKM